MSLEEFVARFFRDGLHIGIQGWVEIFLVARDCFANYNSSRNTSGKVADRVQFDRTFVGEEPGDQKSHILE
jgi:hypothetical protein